MTTLATQELVDDLGLEVLSSRTGLINVREEIVDILHSRGHDVDEDITVTDLILYLARLVESATDVSGGTFRIIESAIASDHCYAELVNLPVIRIIEQAQAIDFVVDPTHVPHIEEDLISAASASDNAYALLLETLVIKIKECVEAADLLQVPQKPNNGMMEETVSFDIVTILLPSVITSKYTEQVVATDSCQAILTLA